VDEASNVLKGIKTIDVFEMARVDPHVPIETSLKTLAELVAEGKIGGIGLSEVSAGTIRRASAVHKIVAVEIELSLSTPDPLYNGIMDTCHKRESLHALVIVSYTPLANQILPVDIPVVAYSPVGRGLLTGTYRTHSDIPTNDFRHMLPRFKPEAFEQNTKLVETIDKFAQRKGLTVAQVAIAWVVRQGAVPIPGSSKLERVEANSRAVDLTDDEWQELEGLRKQCPVVGERYGGVHEKYLNA
jgi:pyridoxine 4-dehydrogenase